MNTLPVYVSSRGLLVSMLVCATSLAWAQSTPPVASPPPPPAVSNAAGQQQLERSMAQGRGGAPAAAPATAMATAPDAAEQSLLNRKTQKVEILHFEDSGNRVDEIRSGGQTERITVRPKDGMPAYEVQPVNRGTTAPGAGIGQAGPRVWRIHQF